MSIQALNWAFKQSLQTPTTKLVLLTLANYCDEKHSCYPSESHIASICGISDRQVRRCISALESGGKLRSEARIGPKGQTSNRYHLSVDTHVHPGPDITVLPSPDTSVQPPRTPASTNTKEDTKELYTEAFIAWWKVYPRKVGKFNAAKSYSKAVKDISHKRLLEATMRFSVINAQTEMRYIPHAATWLNQKRYADEELSIVQTINNLAG